jgi:ATP-dependent DNA helicase RecQ
VIYEAERALELPRLVSGLRDAELREGRDEAIRHIVSRNSHLLVVQKIHWSKRQ